MTVFTGKNAATARLFSEAAIAAPEEQEALLWPEVRAAVDSIIVKTRQDDEPYPKHVRDRELTDFIWSDLRKRAQLFNAPYPYAFLREERTLVNFCGDNADVAYLLRRYGFRPSQRDRSMVLKDLESRITALMPSREAHRLGMMQNGAIYVNAGDSKIFMITPDTITSELNGVNDVVLLDDKLMPWPALTAENLSYMDEVRGMLNGAGMKFTPGTTLCKHLAAQWGQQEMTPDQAQQLYFSRIMFMWIANSYSLWPIMLATGAQNSGKSTIFEKLAWLLYGGEKDAMGLPGTYRSLIATLTNSAFPIFDNLDGGRLDEKDQGQYLDAFCGVATGMEIPLAELYKTNNLMTFRVRNHLMLTCRVTPFNRSDAMRRILQFNIRSLGKNEIRSKDSLKNEIREDRDKCLLETLVRLQNILRDHVSHGTEEYQPNSQMLEYETYTLRCAEAEGFLPEMQAIWQAQMRTYQTEITDSNPLVHLVRHWLGTPNGKNLKREVTPGVLWQELSSISERMGVLMTYKSASAFGKRIKENISPLSTLGIASVGNSSHATYRFDPKPEVVAECRVMYKESMSASTKRLIDGSMARVGSNVTASRRIEGREYPMSLDDPMSEPGSRTDSLESVA
jgi:hypothetical protein